MTEKLVRDKMYTVNCVQRGIALSVLVLVDHFG
jgi:hypothetical protein